MGGVVMGRKDGGPTARIRDDVPAIAVFTFYPGLRHTELRGIGSADADAVRFVAFQLDWLFPSTDPMNVTLDGLGRWSSPTPGVAEAIDLVFGEHYVPTGRDYSRPRAVDVARDVARAFPGTKVEIVQDDVPPSAPPDLDACW